MSWTENEWYQCSVTEFEYVESPVKGTKAFELTCVHPSHGTLVGQWWLSDALNSKGVPQWQAAKDRCIQLGCEEKFMNGFDWVSYIRSVVVGKTVACMAGLDGSDQERWIAKFIGCPKASSSGYKKADASVSFFAEKAARPAVAVADDDVPF